LDGLVAEHKGKKLDELVADRIINADQKAQILKKPALKEQLAQLEEKQSLLAKMAVDLESVVTAKVTEKLTEQFVKEKAEAAELAEADLNQKFLTLSMFLRFVADRRAEEADPAMDQNAALETVLAICFGGDEDAVVAMKKLVDGVQEHVVSSSGEKLASTYATLKVDSENHMKELAKAARKQAETAASYTTPDPTIENIAATEIAAGDKELLNTDPAPAVVPETNGVHPPAEPASEEENDKNDSSVTQEEPAQVTNAPESEDAAEKPSFPALTHTTSWADDHPEPAAQVRN
jgi:hypothetical protein